MGKEKLSLPKIFEATVQSHMPRYHNRDITIELKDDTVVKGRVTEYDPKFMNFTLDHARMKPFRQGNTRQEKRNKDHPVDDQWVHLGQMLVHGQRIRFVHLEQEDNVAEMLADHLRSVGKRRNKLGSDSGSQQRKRKRSKISDERKAKFARMKEEAEEARKRPPSKKTKR